MKLLPKLNPRLARVAYTALQRIGYRFVDLDAEGSFLDSRVFEYTFVISKLAQQPKGKVLDVGCTDSGNIASICLAWLGWEVYGIDNREFKFEHPHFHFSWGDIRNAPFDDNYFDTVYAISTLEHIGLKGRYDVTEDDPEGDLKAVREISRILRPGGTLLITIPYGKARLIRPLHKVYDGYGLRKLFHQWEIKEEIYYAFRDGYWVAVPEKTAADRDFVKGERALAMLELVPEK